MTDPDLWPPADTGTPDKACYWCGTECGGTCLGLTSSTQMRTEDPAYFLLRDGHTSTPTVYRDDCYICRDPEFAAMGMPLCRLCPTCKTGHVPADDVICDDCGAEDGPPPPADEPTTTTTEES